MFTDHRHVTAVVKGESFSGAIAHSDICSSAKMDQLVNMYVCKCWLSNSFGALWRHALGQRVFEKYKVLCNGDVSE